MPEEEEKLDTQQIKETQETQDEMKTFSVLDDTNCPIQHKHTGTDTPKIKYRNIMDKDHASTHESGGTDKISIAGLTKVTTEASSATPTINSDNTDLHSITALATAITSMTTNLSGTPVNGQKLLIRILDNATGRAITWGAKFEDRGMALPTTTTASKLLTVGFIYDTVDSIWGCVAVADET